MADRAFGSPGTSMVRSGVGRVARGARSATLAVCILWHHLSRGKPKCVVNADYGGQLETKECRKRPPAILALGGAPPSRPMERSRRETPVGRERLSLGLHQNTGEHSGCSSRGWTIRIYSCVPAKGDFRPSDLSPGTVLLGKETSCTLHRWSTWTVICTIFINSFRTEKATWYEKRQVTRVQAVNGGGGCHCECRHLEAWGSRG